MLPADLHPPPRGNGRSTGIMVTDGSGFHVGEGVKVHIKGFQDGVVSKDSRVHISDLNIE